MAFLKPLALWAQMPIISTYLPEDYNASPRNWDIAQDSLHHIFVGNDDGVLVFNGYDWELLPVPGRQARSLAADRNGVVYVGTANNFGYIKRTETGAFHYVSLSDQLPPEKRPTWVFITKTTGRQVYFTTQYNIYSYHPVTGLHVYEHDRVILNSTIIRNSLYFMDNTNVYRFVNRQALPIRTRDISAHHSNQFIYNIRPFKGDEYLVLTREGRVFTTLGGLNGQILPWENDFLQDKRPLFHYSYTNSDAFRSTYGDRIILLPTRGQNQYIATESGRLLYTFLNPEHISSPAIEFSHFDQENNLWLATHRGIVKVVFSNPMRVFDEISGINSNVNETLIHNNYIYAATNNGIYYKALDDHSFTLIEGTESQIWRLLSHGSYVVAAGGNSGVLLIKDNTLIHRLSWGFSTMMIAPSRKFEDTFHVGLFNGYTMVRIQNDRISELEGLPPLRAVIRSITETKDGKVWLGTPLQGFFSYHVPEKEALNTIHYQQFGTEAGLDVMEHNFVFEGPHTLLFSSRNALYTFSSEEQRFYPITQDRFLQLRNPYPNVRFTTNAMWYLHDKRRISVSGEGMSDQSAGLPAIPHEIRDVSIQGDIWYLATSSGIFTLPSWFRPSAPESPLVLRSVALPNEKLNLPIHRNELSDVPKIPFRHTDVHFSYFWPIFAFHTEIQYRYKLEGLHQTWTDWRSNPTATFTNLSPGNYTFEVQARDVYGHLSNTISYSFVVPTPIYATRWAWLFYLLIFFGITYSVYRYQTRRLLRRNEHLEHLVENRTQEILRQNAELIEANKTKSRFLSIAAHDMRNPLGVIQGYADLIQESHKEPAKVLELAAHIENISEKMLNMINDLLHPESDDNAHMLVNKTRFDMKPIVAQVVAHNRVLASKKGQQIITELFDTCQFYGDQGRMFEIFDNIISNAVKYSPPDELIFVQLRMITDEENTPKIQFRVSDHGPGIPPEQRVEIFEKRSSGINKTTGGESSSGLGLGIVKQMVEIHGGKVWVDDNPSHETGSRFTVEFVCQEPN